PPPAAHRPLPSSPPRRSSDLGQASVSLRVPGPVPSVIQSSVPWSASVPAKRRVPPPGGLSSSPGEGHASRQPVRDEAWVKASSRSEEHTSELPSLTNIRCPVL